MSRVKVDDNSLKQQTCSPNFLYVVKFVCWNFSKVVLILVAKLNLSEKVFAAIQPVIVKYHTSENVQSKNLAHFQVG